MIAIINRSSLLLLLLLLLSLSLSSLSLAFIIIYILVATVTNFVYTSGLFDNTFSVSFFMYE